MEKWVVVVLLLAAMELAPAEVIRRYVGVGGELKVEPPEISEPITDVLWKYNVNLLAEWIKDPVDLTYYGEFAGRTTLDTSTGHLQVLNMRLEDTGQYSVEINSKLQDLHYDVKVIHEVPQPKVVVRPVTCARDHMKCTLTCDGISAGSEPVSYSWRRGDGPWEKSEKILVITKTETENVSTFSCRMENPIGHRDSEPEDNPLLQTNVGLVVGATVGVTIIVILIIGLSIFVQQRRKLRRKLKQEHRRRQEQERLRQGQEQELKQERLRRQEQEQELEKERLWRQEQEKGRLRQEQELKKERLRRQEQEKELERLRQEQEKEQKPLRQEQEKEQKPLRQEQENEQKPLRQEQEKEQERLRRQEPTQTSWLSWIWSRS